MIEKLKVLIYQNNYHNYNGSISDKTLINGMILERLFPILLHRSDLIEDIFYTFLIELNDCKEVKYFNDVAINS